tara:strand:- start:81 stop:1277 length:1197 start_codon:yes stop_codon:yes gene_type:complete
MSYFSTLSSFQDTQSNIEGHAQDVSDRMRATAKQGVDDKFGFIDGILSKTGGGVGGLGASIHATRRIYKKLQDSKKLASTIQQKAQDAKDAVAKATGAQKNSGDGGTRSEDTDTGTNTNATPDGVGTQTPDANAQTQPSSNDNSASNTSNDGNPATDAQATNDSSVATNSSEAQQGLASTQAPASELPDVGPLGDGSLPGQTIKPPTPAQSTLDSGTQQSSLGGGDSASTRPQLQTTGDNASPSQANPSTQAPKPTPDAGGSGSTPPSSTNPNSNLGGAGGDADGGGSGALDGVTNTLNDVKGVATKAVADISSTADSLMPTLSSVGTALDFMGPIGEIAGAGVGIGELFYNLFNKSHEDSEEDQAQSAVKSTGQSGGIDVANVVHSGSVGGSVGTIL